MNSDQIIEKLRNGAIIIYPTDTIYGIGCLNSSQDSVKMVFMIKNPRANPEDYKKRPFLVGFSDIKQLLEHVKLDKEQEKFIEKNKDNGTSFIVTKNSGETIGIRILSHPLINGIIKKVGPLITTSANLAGKNPPVSYGEIDKTILDQADIVIRGECRLKKASTIWDLTKKPYQTIRN
jgi:L-threonylcarbamoyladenylate synthase